MKSTEKAEQVLQAAPEHRVCYSGKVLPTKYQLRVHATNS